MRTRAKTWWVYILRCADGTLYCGSTNDVEARVAAHNAGKGARYTRGRGPVRLVMALRAEDRCDALRAEARIKRLPRDAKLHLVRTAKKRLMGQEH
ncbi:MAG: GIY-YIG nuclease family protein [bacterium]